MDIRFNSTNGASTVGAPEGTTNGGMETVETPDLLPGASDLMFGGDPGAMLAALTMQTAHQEQKASRSQRDECARAQEKAEAAEIKDLHEKADLMRFQGVVGGALQIGQSALSLVSSMNSLAADNLSDASKEAAQDGADGHDAAKSAPNADQKDAVDASAQRSHDDAIALKSESRNAQETASAYKAAGDFAGATKTLSDALFSGAITDKDTDSKAHDIAAQAFKKMGDDAHDAENDAKALLNKALDFYKEYVDTKNQTAMAAIHRA